MKFLIDVDTDSMARHAPDCQPPTRAQIASVLEDAMHDGGLETYATVVLDDPGGQPDALQNQMETTKAAFIKGFLATVDSKTGAWTFEWNVAADRAEEAWQFFLSTQKKKP